MSSDSLIAAYMAAANLQCVHSVRVFEATMMSCAYAHHSRTLSHCPVGYHCCIVTATVEQKPTLLLALMMQIAVRAEVHLLPAPQRQAVLQSLLQHTLECFKKTLAAQLPDISTGGLLQLLMELQYLHAALAAYISSRLEQTFVELGAMLTERIQEMQVQEQQAQAEQLTAWLSQSQGSDIMECMQARLAQVLSLSSAGQQHNLRALRT